MIRKATCMVEPRQPAPIRRKSHQSSNLAEMISSTISMRRRRLGRTSGVSRRQKSNRLVGKGGKMSCRRALAEYYCRDKRFFRQDETSFSPPLRHSQVCCNALSQVRKDDSPGRQEGNRKWELSTRCGAEGNILKPPLALGVGVRCNAKRCSSQEEAKAFVKRRT